MFLNDWLVISYNSHKTIIQVYTLMGKFTEL